MVRPCDYRSNLASVTVKCTNLFTVVTVNGVEVYFQRGTGTFEQRFRLAADFAQGVR